MKIRTREEYNHSKCKPDLSNKIRLCPECGKKTQKVGMFWACIANLDHTPVR